MLRKVRDLFVAYNKRAGGRTLTQSMLLGFARGLDLRLPIGLEGSVYRVRRILAKRRAFRVISWIVLAQVKRHL